MIIKLSEKMCLDIPPEDPFRAFVNRFTIAFLCLLAGFNFVKWWIAPCQ